MAVKKAEHSEEIQVRALSVGSARFRIIGQTPMYQNRMSAKVKQQLLVGGRKKTKADRAHIKHDPMQEFRDSAEILPEGPTALGIRTVALKSAMCTAALETAGITKTSAQRLIFMPGGELIGLYGLPYLKMDVTRSADINRTPDVRTRAFLPKWGAEVEVKYIVPQLSVASVLSLLFNAGVLVGIGDFRQEKGKGSFGSFRVLSTEDDDAEWEDLVQNHGRKAQEAALAYPEYYDRDTEDLMAFYTDEVERRAG